MRKVPRDTIEEAIGISCRDVELYESYSGRFMYGEHCFGLVGTHEGIQAAMVEIAILDNQLGRELSRASRQDSMGHDVIIYFPDYQIEEEEVPESA